MLSKANMPDDAHEITGPSRSTRFIKLLLLLIVVLLLNSGGGWLAHQINFQLYPRHIYILSFWGVLGFTFS